MGKLSSVVFTGLLGLVMLGCSVIVVSKAETSCVKLKVSLDGFIEAKEADDI